MILKIKSQHSNIFSKLFYSKDLFEFNSVEANFAKMHERHKLIFTINSTCSYGNALTKHIPKKSVNFLLHGHSTMVHWKSCSLIWF